MGEVISLSDARETMCYLVVNISCWARDHSNSVMARIYIGPFDNAEKAEHFHKTLHNTLEETHADREWEIELTFVDTLSISESDLYDKLWTAKPDKFDIERFARIGHQVVAKQALFSATESVLYREGHDGGYNPTG